MLTTKKQEYLNLKHSIRSYMRQQHQITTERRTFGGHFKAKQIKLMTTKRNFNFECFAVLR